MKPVYNRLLLKLSGEVLAGDAGHGFDFNVIVSPTLISDKFLILAAIYPTSPASSFSQGEYAPGSKCPTSVTTKVLLLAINKISSPTFILPSFTLTYAIAPLSVGFESSGKYIPTYFIL